MRILTFKKGLLDSWKAKIGVALNIWQDKIFEIDTFDRCSQGWSGQKTIIKLLNY